ncbi:hypothetical protein BJX76DRAFT_328159 [Aspergillus varians]
MESRSPKDEDGQNNSNSHDSAPENPEAVRRHLAEFSISQGASKTESSDSNEPIQSSRQQEQAHDGPDTGEERSSRTYRINTLRRDSDEPEEQEQGGESSNIKPDELLNVLFDFDTPREINLNVKIKGDFNVTILYAHAPLMTLSS